MSEAEPQRELSRLGGYTIVRKLAKGGMAEIYLARSLGPEGFEKLVVLKRILPKYAENPKFVQLFLEEAKLAASLDHPHIVHVYDMGRVDGHYFFTMEYVHGQDSRSILRKASRGKDVPIAIAVLIARTMAAALHHAHERKRPDGTARDVVHRDVSPSNILVSYDGAIKLADFGVAKAASSTVRTRTGALKGKVGYMSPEQARGMAIDRRSDIFSLGVVLWELVAMRRLFKTDNDLATIQAIINATPPLLTEFRRDSPPELDRIVRKALEKDPATRYQTAQQLQHDLEELARELKLDQSSIALSTYMSDLFAEEISAWRDAQSAGATVTDFIVSHSSPMNATPVSESDFSLDDPGDVEEEDLEEDDEEDPEAAVPTLPPRAGVIDEPDDRTDFGPPPVMADSAVDNPQMRPPAPTPRPLASTVPRVVKPPVLPGRDTEREDNPFDDAATRLRNKTIDTDPAFIEAPTKVGTTAFVDEAPTVSAPPDILEKAFAETDETVQAIPRYTGEKPPMPFLPAAPSSGLYEKEAPTIPFAKPTVGTQPYPQPKPPDLPSVPHASTMKPPPLPGVRPPTFTPSEPQPPVQQWAPNESLPPQMMPHQMQAPDPMPIGSFPPGTMGVGSYAPNTMPQASGPVPVMHGYPVHPQTPPMGYPMGGDLDPNLSIDLAPQKRWVMIGGIAVGVMVLLIVLVVIFSRGSTEEPVPEEPAPVKVEPKPAPKAEAKPATKPEPKVEPKPAAVAAKPEPTPEPPPVAIAPPKITKQPPIAKPKPKRR